MSDDGVTEYAWLTVAEADTDAFEKAFAQGRPVLEGAPGCLGAELFADAERPDGYLLVVRWERLADHVEVFPASEAGREFAGHVAHFFAEPPQVRHALTLAVGV